MTSRSIREEADALKQIEHPNIVQFIGAHTTPTGERTFLELKYDGCNLEEAFGTESGVSVLKTEISSPREKRKIIQKTATGLAYLHQNGMIHRDLTPRNILINSRLEVRVCDLGEHLKIKDHPNHDQKGTPQYRAPDWLTSFGWRTTSDVWSLGCVTYWIFTQKHLFPELHNTENFPIYLARSTFLDKASRVFSLQDLNQLKDWLMSARNRVKDGVPSRFICKLCMQMLTFRPDWRMSVKEVANNPVLTQGFSGQ